MKKIFVIITTLIVMSSCATTNETKSPKIKLREENKLAKQEVIKEAVESRRYIIKFDKIYFTRGGMVDLIPRTNYIIIDGRKAIISAAYLGRQYDIRPIAGISLQGETDNYELISNLSKGMYEIKMKVNNGSNSFDINLRISQNGYCSASLTNIKLDYVRYSGHISPIKDKIRIPQQNGDRI